MAFANYGISKEICDALGLKEVIDCQISLKLNDVARVTVEYFPSDEHVKKVLSVIKKYKLVPLDK